MNLFYLGDFDFTKSFSISPFILFRIVSQRVSIKFVKKILFGLDFSVCLCLWTSPFLYCFLQNTHIMKPVSMNEGSLKRPIKKGFKLKNLTKTIGLKIGIKKASDIQDTIPYHIS